MALTLLSASTNLAWYSSTLSLMFAIENETPSESMKLDTLSTRFLTSLKMVVTLVTNTLTSSQLSKMPPTVVNASYLTVPSYFLAKAALIAPSGFPVSMALRISLETALTSFTSCLAPSYPWSLGFFKKENSPIFSIANVGFP